MTKAYSEWEKADLIKEIKQLKKRKKFGLVWEDKPEEVAEMCKTHLPVLEDEANKDIITNKDLPTNFIIEGDNYHALSVLNYTHKNKIDVIYIDPPYNTGAKDWKYNNNFVDNNDSYRHSKWISMMSKRLILAKNLLSSNGVIICAIDENEIHNLRHLLDEIFGEKNKLGTVTVLHNPKGRNLSKFFSENSEYMLVYSRNVATAKFNDVAIDEEVQATFNLKDEEGYYRHESFMRVRSSWSREKRPKNYYPIYVSKDLKEITLENKKGYYKVYPKTKDGREWAWKNISESFTNLNHDGYFQAELHDGTVTISHKYREKQVLKNVWTNKKYQSEFNGTNLLKKILGGNFFDYPKSIYLVEDILKIVSKKDSIILDFFAGSGTTGHAVLKLNKDGGSRQFILCTNNENNIAEEVTYPRIKNVIEGYKDGNSDVEGLGGNLKYYKTRFVNKVVTDADRRNFVNHATEMLCLAEGTFEQVIFKKGKFAVYSNGYKVTGIIYDEDFIKEAKKELKGIEKKMVIYVFSYDNHYEEADFSDMPKSVEVKPIPAVILNVYQRIIRQGAKKINL